MKSKKLIIVSVTFFISIFYCKGQANDVGVRDEILSIAEKIATDGSVTDSLFMVYANPVNSYQWERFLELQEKALDNELIVLTNHPNGAVRCYAFRALVMNNNTACFEILKDHLIDGKHINFRSFDNKHNPRVSSVGDYFIYCISVSVSENSYLLSDQQKVELDSIILYNDSITLSYRNRLLRRLKPNPVYYERVREIVIKELDLDALVALARYRNPNDIPLFKDCFRLFRRYYDGLYSLLLAIREYPAPSFYGDLIRMLKRDRGNWRLLYQALARYPTDETVKLFERISKEKVKPKNLNAKKELLMIAITKYPHEKYERLKNELKVDPDILEQLWESEREMTEWENGE